MMELTGSILELAESFNIHIEAIRRQRKKKTFFDGDKSALMGRKHILLTRKRQVQPSNERSGDKSNVFNCLFACRCWSTVGRNEASIRLTSFFTDGVLAAALCSVGVVGKFRYQFPIWDAFDASLDCHSFLTIFNISRTRFLEAELLGDILWYRN